MVKKTENILFNKNQYVEQFKRDHYDISRILIRRDSSWYQAFLDSMRDSGESKSSWVQKAMIERLIKEGRIKKEDI